MEFTTEQIEKAKNCKTFDEFKDLAKAEGIELSDEEAKMYFDSTHQGELDDESLSIVAGGKGNNWVPIRTRNKNVTCPFCNANLNVTITLYEDKNTKQRDKKHVPNKCTCGAEFEYTFTTNNWTFIKNGERRYTR